MFPTWRLRLREARLAWRNGRVDEAGTLLSESPLCEFLPAKELAQDVAATMLARAGERLANGESNAGWNDLAAAERLVGVGEAGAELRRQYAQRALREVELYLAAGEPEAALTRLAQLHRHGIEDQAARQLRQIAQEMRSANQLAERGHFAEAGAANARAASLAAHAASGTSTMEELHQRLAAEGKDLSERSDQCRQLTTEMHAALASQDWSAVLRSADSLLAIAPTHTAATQARRKAWREVGMDVTQPYRSLRPVANVSIDVARPREGAGRRSTRVASAASEVDTVAGNNQPQRALLWVDAVGGFLVCLDDRIVLGQPAAGDAISVPILADVSRRHAVIRRDAGAYVLEPIQQVSVDGRPISGPYVLADRQVIELGAGVRLRFTKPHALSATAKLILESHHKTQPSADAVMLMADSLVLGPNRHCHVPCREWEQDLVIFRQSGRLFCRGDRPMMIDGVLASAAAELPPGARVEGDDFAFTWETV